MILWHHVLCNAQQHLLMISLVLVAIVTMLYGLSRLPYDPEW